jgi:SAM-dependent methyltransferase
MDLDRLRRTWENWGRKDPMWAIMTQPGKEGGRWDEAEFFRTGEADVAWAGSWLGLHRIAVPEGDALDFGCGIGRLTQALAPHFRSVTGVDISAPMVELARQKNRHGERVRYVCNPYADMAQFATASFAFVHSMQVLQHMRPEYALGYLREFLRVLQPGGLLFFQIPTSELRPSPSRMAPAIEPPDEAHMEMYVTPLDQVLAVLTEGGGKVLQQEEDRMAGPHWRSFHLAVGRQ